MNLQIKHQSTESKHLIIFIHGIGGNCESFQNDNKEYFHEFLHSQILDCCDIGYYTYTSKIISSKIKSMISNYITYFDEEFNKEIFEISDILKTDFLNLVDKYETINFICHSMGGLIVKDLLLNKQIEFDKRTFYITLATPHKGSKIADKFFFIKSRHSQIKVLKTDLNILAQLNTEFKYQKEKLNSKFYYGIFDTIVPKEFAFSDNCEELLLGVNGNHINICKPTIEEKHVTLLVNINKTIKKFLNISKVSPSNKTQTKLNLLSLVLFDILCENSKAYYLIKEIDQILINTLKIKNIWIYGESGVGKTAAAKYYFLNNNKHFKCAIYFTSTNKVAEEYLQLIYEDLVDKLEIQDCPISDNINVKISKVLSYLSKNHEYVTIHLDELSDLGKEEFEVFIISLVDILTNPRNNCNLNNIKFIITTIFNPTSYINNIDNISAQEKLKSKFLFTELNRWEEIHLLKLCNLISSHLSNDLSGIESVINSAEGKPRNLKELIKTQIATEGI